jgi:hypothetical protein
VAENSLAEKIWGAPPAGSTGGLQYAWFRIYAGGIGLSCGTPSGYDTFPGQGAGYTFTDMGSYSVGAPYQVACAEGYSGNPEQVVCGESGSWEPAPAVWTGCEPIVCGEPRPKVGYSIADGPEQYAAARSVVCVPGYTGSVDDITCQENGQWTSPSGCSIIFCGRVPGYDGLPPQIGYDFAVGDNYEFQATRTAVCATGFTGDASAISCTAEGTWSLSTGCSPINCNQPEPQEGYEVPQFVLNLGFATEYTLNCSTGYEGMEDGSVAGTLGFQAYTGRMICDGDATWSFHGCVPSVCDQPDISSGYLISDVDRLFAGVTHSSDCAEGYEGAGEITCNDDSSWSASGCDPVDCGQPEQSENYVIGTATNHFFEDEFEIDCAEGYTGSPVLTCQADGSWTDPSGCEPIDCGQPSEETGYDTSVSASETGYAATYSCECAVGYYGTGTMICGDSSGSTSWSASGCDPVDCGQPEQSENYVIGTATNHFFEDEFEIDCAEGYTGSPVLTCQADGSWTDPSGCEVTTCPEYELEGFLVEAGENFYLSERVVICIGEGLEGSFIVVCGADGTWTGLDGETTTEGVCQLTSVDVTAPDITSAESVVGEDFFESIGAIATFSYCVLSTLLLLGAY